MRSPRALGAIAVVGFIAVMVISCWPNDLFTVEQRVRRLPFVEYVHYRAGSFLEPEQLDIGVVDGVTNEQILRLYCHILLPHGANDDNTVVHTVSDTRFFALPDCSATD